MKVMFLKVCTLKNLEKIFENKNVVQHFMTNDFETYALVRKNWDEKVTEEYKVIDIESDLEEHAVIIVNSDFESSMLSDNP